MINTEVQMEAIEYIESVECDVCGKTVDSGDHIEMQEFQHIDFQGGYGSVFGDGNDITCDICQECLLKMIYPHMRTNGLTQDECDEIAIREEKEREEMHDEIPDFGEWVEPVIKGDEE